VEYIEFVEMGESRHRWWSLLSQTPNAQVRLEPRVPIGNDISDPCDIDKVRYDLVEYIEFAEMDKSRHRWWSLLMQNAQVRLRRLEPRLPIGNDISSERTSISALLSQHRSERLGRRQP
jgi:hypothetical protein